MSENLIDSFKALSEADRQQILLQILEKTTLFCGCGQPDEALKFLQEALTLAARHKHDEVRELCKSVGAYWFILYMLDALGLTEHGGNVSGAWSSEDGVKLTQLLGVRE